MNNKSKNSLITYFLLLLSILVLFLFTKNIYYSVKENSENLASLKEQISQKNQEYDNLSKIKLDIESWKSDVKDLNKYLVNFNEPEITNYLYSYANSNVWKLRIEAINLTEWKLNEFWINEWKIDLEVSFATETDMINMVNFLLNSETYNFFIHDFNYEYWNISWPFKVTIPLKVLYK